MQSDKPWQMITKVNIVSTILIIIFCITLFLGHERVCALIYPSPIKVYKSILGDKTKNFRGQKISNGHTINFQFRENKKSLGELYALTDIKFIPEDKSLPIWTGRDKPEKWNSDTALIENMQRFRIKFAIPVPDDKNLTGQTIKGTLHFKLTYPVLTDYTRKISAIISEATSKSISIHIFSQDQIKKLSQLTSQMIKIWIFCLCTLLFPILLIKGMQLRKNKKRMPPRVV
jgi:hypothetical protein